MQTERLPAVGLTVRLTRGDLAGLPAVIMAVHPFANDTYLLSIRYDRCPRTRRTLHDDGSYWYDVFWRDVEVCDA